MEDIQVEEQAPIVEQAAEEKMLPQSHVNKLVAREKESAAMRARQQAEMEYQQKLEALQQAQLQQHQRNDNVSREVDYDLIQQKVTEDLNRREMEKQIAHVAQSYVSRMQSGRELYDDFDEVTSDFDPTAFPQLTYLVSGMDNGGDVVYELSKNPTKLVALDDLAKRSPGLAQKELLKLSRSITDNRTAAQEASGQSSNAPLDRLNPSRVSGSDGNMSIKDLRAQPWLRG